jgi:superfamily II DNA or RNA helicase
MNFNIVDFLPKYPSITESATNDVLNTYNEKFNLATYKKKEFYEERLSASEDFPKSSGMLLKHQKIISRFLSSHTPYDQILLVHEMGTGKTCSAIGTIEKIKHENSSFTGALILARGKRILGNFKDELMFKCTDGRYIPENYEQLSHNEKMHRTNKLINTYYNLRTFETFAKEINKSPDDMLIKKYSNKIIVIDEIHNIRIKNKKTEDLNIYKEFHRFLHIVKNCKIILMSGTPMKDNPSEIASVMNLILPLNEQFSNNFSYEYMEIKNGEMIVRKDMEENLKNKFRGRISYLKTSSSEVQKNFVGLKIGTLKYFKVYPTIMETFQAEKYIEAYRIDKNVNETENNQTGIYKHSSQAILFVFPDGSYGSKGFKKYIKLSTSNISGNKVFSFKDNSITSLFKNLSDEQKIIKLRKYSTKYADIIQSIIIAEAENKNCFIYNDLIYGSGSILFSLILKDIFGFHKSTGNESTKRRRFGLINTASTNNNEIKQIISRFNKPDNMNGEFIRVIIGSRVISEGITLKNVQVEHIVTPHWNYSETSQAISRGWRFGSHKDLLDAGIIPVLNIYQHVSLMPGRIVNNSLDLIKYQISEKKDVSIKNIERVIKKSAFDCALNYDRNYVPGYDNERECEYKKCDYRCDNVSRRLIGSLEEGELDLSTYNLYYGEANIENIKKNILKYFKTKFETTLSAFRDLPEMQSYSMFEIITALRHIINDNVIVRNKLGFPSYLREKNNVYFLVNYVYDQNNFLISYYNKHPIIKNKKDLSTIVYTDIVNNIFRNPEINILNYYIPLLSIETQNYLMENTIGTKILEINNPVIDILLTYFEPKYKIVEGTWISTFFPNKKYFDRDEFEWKDYTENFKNSQPRGMMENTFDENKEILYRFSGLYKDNVFSIKKLDQDKKLKKEDDKRVNTGQSCKTLTKGFLYKIAIEHEVPIDEDDIQYINISKQSKESLIVLAKKNTFIKKLHSAEELDNMDTEQLIKILYWGIKGKEYTCEKLEDWFKSENLIRY